MYEYVNTNYAPHFPISASPHCPRRSFVDPQCSEVRNVLHAKAHGTFKTERVAVNPARPHWARLLVFIVHCSTESAAPFEGNWASRIAVGTESLNVPQRILAYRTKRRNS
jgi:hypothetical protein